MKKLKHIIIAAAILATAPFMQSCDNDDDNVRYFSELGTVGQMTTNGSSWIVEGDIYGNSLIKNQSALSMTKTDSIGQRILYYFTDEGKSDNKDVEMNTISIFNIYKVLTKKADLVDDLTTVDKEFGNDPIMITGAYASKEHLNIRFQLVGSNSDIKHRISLVGQKDITPDKDGVITFDLRHNANNDMRAEYKWGYVSYTLESIPGFKEGTLKKIVVKYKISNSEDRTVSIEIKDDKPTTMSMNATEIANSNTAEIN